MRRQKTWLVLILCVGIGLIAALAADRNLPGRTNEKKPMPQPTPLAAPPPKKTVTDLPGTMREFFLDRESTVRMPPGIYPRDHIDILASDRIPGSSKGSIARIILEDILVHQVVTESGSPVSPTERASGLTLLLSPGQSMVLASMIKTSDIRITKRNPMDTRHSGEQSVRYTPRDGVTQENLPWSHDRYRITPGMRAFTVSVHESDGICAKTRPGDRVDVLFSVSTSLVTPENLGSAEGTTSRKTGENTFSRIFLENITVLATEQSYRPDPTDTNPVNLLVLEVTPRDAEKLAMMVDTQSGIVLRLLSRNPEDKTSFTGKGYNFDQLLHRKNVASRVSVIRNGSEIEKQPFYK